MRYISDLITQIRRHTNNQDVSLTTGIPDELFLQYLNDAQDRLQSLISNLKPPAKIFTREVEIPIVANQSEYSIPDRVFYNKQVDGIEYSSSGLVKDYFPLRKITFGERSTDTTTWPVAYYRRFGKFYPSPIPSTGTGKFRVIFERSLDDLDKRRGKVSSISGLSSTTFTSLVVDSSADETSTPNLSTADYICICDKDGNVTAYNIPVSNYDTGTNTLTPVGSFTFQAGETIAVNSYITIGKYTTTHSALPDECERYLFHYCAESIFHKDSSTDIVAEGSLLDRMEKDIIKMIGSQTSEVQDIPRVRENEDFFIY